MGILDFLFNPLKDVHIDEDPRIQPPPPFEQDGDKIKCHGQVARDSRFDYGVYRANYYHKAYDYIRTMPRDDALKRATVEAFIDARTEGEKKHAAFMKHAEEYAEAHRDPQPSEEYD